MISKEDYMEIESQHARGVYKKDIARKLGVHPRTVTRALKRGGPAVGKRPQAKKSKLDPYKEFVDQELAAVSIRTGTPFDAILDAKAEKESGA